MVTTKNLPVLSEDLWMKIFTIYYAEGTTKMYSFGDTIRELVSKEELAKAIYDAVFISGKPYVEL